MAEKIYNITRTSITEQVCDSMKQNVIDGTWKVGDKLPSEGQLSEMFGVNKLTIRIALQKLNALGILETRTGSGTYVISFNFTNYIQEAYHFYMEPELINQVNEYRQAIEIKSAQLAIERATSQDLLEFKEILENYQEIWLATDTPPSEESFSDIAWADIAFHRHICKMSHNKLFCYAFTLAEQTLYEYILMMNKNRVGYWNKTGTDFSKIVREKDTHAIIYKAITDSDFETCRKYYLDMINPEANW